ncbi:hypothetical protein MUP01_13965 [Candidatus Bathyarchaeota archaeon]|nr:hypothetical protein [Candidatus Bathyarchaeota archaeon]
MFDTISETLLSTIFTASIASAGLIIAILSLVAQLRNRIFERRLVTAQEKRTEFDNAKENITPEESYKGAEQLKAIGSEIASMKALPTYLTSRVKFVLAGFFITAFFSLFWLTNAVENQGAEALLILLFCFSILGFFVVVGSATEDVQELMKEEFEQLKKVQEEMERKRKELENFKKHSKRQ